jgi:RNA recognition motif-containing protein
MKLHIGNLPKSLSDSELSDLITAVAKPTLLEVVKDNAGVSKGFAFATFATEEEARAVIAAVDGREVSGNQLKLGEARPRKGEVRPA